MKKLLLLLPLLCLSMVSDITHERNCKATYYDTRPHKRVHREYPTAAFKIDGNFKRNSKLLVTNLVNEKTDTVVITDMHGMGNNHIDLSLMAFDRLSKLDTIVDSKKRNRIRRMMGVMRVKVKLIK
jgi:hypothetical protein